ncbi:hypothetical protein AGMMS50293_10200 [Spirochaetia bacterium]|nr:hypothetical protein AGMMS50293_10200 [Spirochaetia bacterium]
MFRYAILSLFLFFAILMTANAQAVFIEIRGTVEYRPANAAEWKPAVQGDTITPGTVISTSFKSTAIINAGSSRIVIRPLTKLTLEDIIQNANSDDIKLFVQTGRIRADVEPPQNGRINFTVRSPQVTNSVRGTSFEFDTVNLRVLSGVVRYSYKNGMTVFVAKGEASYVEEEGRRVVPPQEIAAGSHIPHIPQFTGIDTGLRVPQIPSGSNVDFTLRPHW